MASTVDDDRTTAPPTTPGAEETAVESSPWLLQSGPASRSWRSSTRTPRAARMRRHSLEQADPASPDWLRRASTPQAIVSPAAVAIASAARSDAVAAVQQLRMRVQTSESETHGFREENETLQQAIRLKRSELDKLTKQLARQRSTNRELRSSLEQSNGELQSARQVAVRAKTELSYRLEQAADLEDAKAALQTRLERTQDRLRRAEEAQRKAIADRLARTAGLSSPTPTRAREELSHREQALVDQEMAMRAREQKLADAELRMGDMLSQLRRKKRVLDAKDQELRAGALAAAISPRSQREPRQEVSLKAPIPTQTPQRRRSSRTTKRSRSRTIATMLCEASVPPELPVSHEAVASSSLALVSIGRAVSSSEAHHQRQLRSAELRLQEVVEELTRSKASEASLRAELAAMRVKVADAAEASRVANESAIRMAELRGEEAVRAVQQQLDAATDGQTDALRKMQDTGKQLAEALVRTREQSNRVGELEAAQSVLEETLAKQRFEIGQIELQHSRQVEQLQDEVAAKRLQVEQLQDEAAAKRLQVEQLQDEVAAKRLQVEQLQDEGDSTLRASSVQSQHTEELRQQLQHLREVYAAREDEFTAAQVAMEEEVVKERQARETEVAATIEELQASKNQVLSLKQSLQDRMAELRSREEELDECQAKLHSAQRAMESTAVAHEAQTQRAQLKAETALAKCEQQLALVNQASTASQEAWHATEERLRGKLGDAARQLVDAQKAKREAQGRAREQERRGDDLAGQLADAMKQFHSISAAAIEARAEMERTKHSSQEDTARVLQESQVRIQALESRFMAAQAKCEELERGTQALKDDAAAAHSRSQSDQEALHKALEEISAIRASLRGEQTAKEAAVVAQRQAHQEAARDKIKVTELQQQLSEMMEKVHDVEGRVRGQEGQLRAQQEQLRVAHSRAIDAEREAAAAKEETEAATKRHRAKARASARAIEHERAQWERQLRDAVDEVRGAAGERVAVLSEQLAGVASVHESMVQELAHSKGYAMGVRSSIGPSPLPTRRPSAVSVATGMLDDLPQGEQLTAEDLQHPPATTTEDLQHPPAPMTEDLQHPPATTTEDLQHPPATTTEDLQHPPATTTEDLQHPPATTTEDLVAHPVGNHITQTTSTSQAAALASAMQQQQSAHRAAAQALLRPEAHSVAPPATPPGAVTASRVTTPALVSRPAQAPEQPEQQVSLLQRPQERSRRRSAAQSQSLSAGLDSSSPVLLSRAGVGIVAPAPARLGDRRGGSRRGSQTMFDGATRTSTLKRRSIHPPRLSEAGGGRGTPEMLRVPTRAFAEATRYGSRLHQEAEHEKQKPQLFGGVQGSSHDKHMTSTTSQNDEVGTRSLRSSGNEQAGSISSSQQRLLAAQSAWAALAEAEQVVADAIDRVPRSRAPSPISSLSESSSPVPQSPQTMVNSDKKQSVSVSRSMPSLSPRQLVWEASSRTGRRSSSGSARARVEAEIAARMHHKTADGTSSYGVGHAVLASSLSVVGHEPRPALPPRTPLDESYSSLQSPLTAVDTARRLLARQSSMQLLKERQSHGALAADAVEDTSVASGSKQLLAKPSSLPLQRASTVANLPVRALRLAGPTAPKPPPGQPPPSPEPRILLAHALSFYKPTSSPTQGRPDHQHRDNFARSDKQAMESVLNATDSLLEASSSSFRASNRRHSFSTVLSDAQSWTSLGASIHAAESAGQCADQAQAAAVRAVDASGMELGLSQLSN